MNKGIAVSGAMALAMLAACSKPAPDPAVEVGAQGGTTAAAPQPEPARPSMGPADYPAKLLPLIDERPECQPFRAELEVAGKVQSADPLPIDMNQVNEIVLRASEAGCTRKP
jgi:hypothetical protein